jgi:hypothetical protein
LPDGATLHVGSDDLSVVMDAENDELNSLLARFNGAARIIQLPGASSADRRAVALANAMLRREVAEDSVGGPFEPSDVTAVEVVLPAGWPAPGREPDDNHFDQLRTAKTLSDLCDAALEIARSVQHAWNVSHSEHVPLIRRGHLPVAVPYQFGWLFDDDTERRIDDPPTFLPINAAAAPDHVGAPADGSWQRFTDSFDAVHADHPLYNYVRLRNQARSIWDHDGDRSLAVVVANTAVEVLLDEVLGLLLWEERMRPPDASSEFSHADAWARMKHRLEPRLGAGWDPKAKNTEAAAFARDLANLRNRVVHAGVVPTRDQTFAALAVLPAVERALRDSLTRPNVLASYPLTAIATCGGSDGLEGTGHLTRRVVDRLEQVADVNLSAVYRRWEWHVLRQRQQDADEPGTDAAVTDVVVVAQPDGNTTWWLYDRATRHAAPLPDRDDETVHRIAAATKQLGEPVQILADEENPGTTTGPWIPDYEVLPNHFVFPDDAPAYHVD